MGHQPIVRLFLHTDAARSRTQTSRLGVQRSKPLEHLVSHFNYSTPNFASSHKFSLITQNMKFFWKKKAGSIPAHIAASLRKSSCSFCLDHIAASICWSYMFGHSYHRWYNTVHSFCQSCILDCSSLRNSGSILCLSCIFVGSYHYGIPGTRLF